MYKTLLARISLSILLLLVLNFIYSKWFYEADLQKHSTLINLVREVPKNTDILYIGESSNITFRSNDIDKSPISTFLGNHYPNLNTYDITKPASHSGIYKVLLNHIPTKSEIKTVVVTLNLRSFNAQWIFSKLETPLQKSLVLLKPYPPLFNRFLLSFKAYDIKSEEERKQQFLNKWKEDEFQGSYPFPYKNVREWDYGMHVKGIKDSLGNIDRKQTELASHYIKAYAFQIDTLHNPRINDFNEIVRLAKERGWNLVFNLMAENTEKAAELVGTDLLYLMNQNTKLLEQYYGSKGVLVVNNLHAVENEQFIDQHWTTEHYAEKGRKTIAKNVALALKQWHGNAYEEVNDDLRYKTAFFNNCDDKHLVWGQRKSISEEQAYSGKKSSQTGAGNDYSIVMSYPLKVIPDSLKNHLHINLMFYQNAPHHQAKLVVQASGLNFKSFWKGFVLNQKNSPLNTWINYQKKIAIPDSIKQADIIKVYVYNTSDEKVYIDDFSIKFMP